MIKRTLLAAAIFSALPAYAGLTSITAGYDFTDYSGDHGNRNLAYAELVAKVENATLLFNLSQGRRDYETEHFNATRGQGAVWGRCEQVPDMRSCLSSGAMEQGSS